VDIIAMAKDSADGTAGLLSDIENLERSINRLMVMLDKVMDYVGRVVVGIWTWRRFKRFLCRAEGLRRTIVFSAPFLSINI
jgi:hypothetical protein